MWDSKSILNLIAEHGHNMLMLALTFPYTRYFNFNDKITSHSKNSFSGALIMWHSTSSKIYKNRLENASTIDWRPDDVLLAVHNAWYAPQGDLTITMFVWQYKDLGRYIQPRLLVDTYKSYYAVSGKGINPTITNSEAVVISSRIEFPVQMFLVFTAGAIFFAVGIIVLCVASMGNGRMELKICSDLRGCRKQAEKGGEG